MSDLIDRQSVLDIVMCYCPDDDGSCSKADVDIRELLDEIENLPAASHFIPCSERLPGKQGRCLVTTESKQIEILTFLFSLTQGAAPYFSGCERVIAWMPMPDAYKLPESEVQSGAEDELKPCPFCGGKAELRQEDFDPRWMPTRNDPDSGGCPPYYVKCNDCGASTEYRYAYSDAVELWNRRSYEKAD